VSNSGAIKNRGTKNELSPVIYAPAVNAPLEYPPVIPVVMLLVRIAFGIPFL
jgi:hypothetical protein